MSIIRIVPLSRIGEKREGMGASLCRVMMMMMIGGGGHSCAAARMAAMRD